MLNALASWAVAQPKSCLITALRSLMFCANDSAQKWQFAMRPVETSTRQRPLLIRSWSSALMALPDLKLSSLMVMHQTTPNSLEYIDPMVGSCWSHATILVSQHRVTTSMQQESSLLKHLVNMSSLSWKSVLADCYLMDKWLLMVLQRFLHAVNHSLVWEALSSRQLLISSLVNHMNSSLNAMQQISSGLMAPRLDCSLSNKTIPYVGQLNSLPNAILHLLSLAPLTIGKAKVMIVTLLIFLVVKLN